MKIYKHEQYLEHEIYLPTTDQFYPNYPNDTVRVKVILCTKIWGYPAIRTCVWGADDCGYDRDEKFGTKKQARQAYKKRVDEINSWKVVTRKKLKELGFITA
ncbi:MAG: hypothetical protein ACTSW7_00635 [Candidatus Thorarchaeota archaeon]|nr:MAG: hypothetical protein DRQ25_16430 [Candidatus Fermentibacteria bacterium]HEC72591.1 hypothetical protein [Thermoplasmatales archaeon]